MISYNPTALVDMPKLHQKNIIQLDPDEIAILLDSMEEQNINLTPHQKSYYNKTILRDFAIVTLLLGTGIRVSECVGIDLTDIDFRNNGVKITRKGGNETIVYFGKEVEKALLNYLEQRKQITPKPGNEQAFFLSIQKKRISLNYSWISIRPNNCTMSSKIDSGSSNYSEIICQKGIKSLWQFLEELFSCQGSLIVAIPAVHTVC